MLNIHYCMGEFAGVNYGHEEVQECGMCGMKEKEKDCCHSELKVYKSDDNHLPSGFVTFFEKWTDKYYPEVKHAIFTASGVEVAPTYSLYNFPPNLRSNSIYLYNQVFRI